jgi:hypothetical protein
MADQREPKTSSATLRRGAGRLPLGLLTGVAPMAGLARIATPTSTCPPVTRPARKSRTAIFATSSLWVCRSATSPLGAVALKWPHEMLVRNRADGEEQWHQLRNPH